MRTSTFLMMLVLLAGAALADVPAPSPDASDLAALQAYKRDPKNADVLFDYYMSLLSLERYKEAHGVLDEWRRAAPTDTRMADVAELLTKLEREPDRKKRQRIADDWAIAQRRAVEAEHHAIADNMAQLDRGLQEMTKEQAARTPQALPQLKQLAEKEPTAEHWLAYADALVAAGDFHAALAAAEEAAKRDPASALAAVEVVQLKQYDGKNGDDVRKALQRERVNAVVKRNAK